MYLQVPQWIESERAQASIDDLHCAVQFPLPFAMLCLHGRLQSLLLPSPTSQGWWRASRWFQNALNPEVLNSFEASRRALPPAMFDGERFSLQSCGQLAQDLRTCLEGGVGGHERLLLNWVCSLQEREDSMKLFRLSSRLAVFMQMIELVMLAERLRSAGRLQDRTTQGVRALDGDSEPLAALEGSRRARESVIEAVHGSSNLWILERSVHRLQLLGLELGHPRFGPVQSLG